MELHIRPVLGPVVEVHHLLVAILSLYALCENKGSWVLLVTPEPGRLIVKFCQICIGFRVLIHAETTMLLLFQRYGHQLDLDSKFSNHLVNVLRHLSRILQGRRSSGIRLFHIPTSLNAWRSSQPSQQDHIPSRLLPGKLALLQLPRDHFSNFGNFQPRP